jgi:hypothetical protein
MGEQTSLAKIEKETKAYLLDAKQLSAVPSAFNPAQLQLLHQVTPEQHIHTFPSNAGKMAGLKFVTGGYMKHMLDRLTGGTWSEEVKEKGTAGGQIWVLMRVTLYKPDGTVLLFKEQFGRANIKYLKGTKDPVDLGNDMKAAATDAFKKCASEIGIARDIYAPHEFLEADIVERKDVEELAKSDTESGNDEPNSSANVPAHEPVDQRFKDMVTALLTEAYPQAYKRMEYIKNMTKKINLAACNDWDWRFMYDDLKAKKLAALEADGEAPLDDEEADAAE